ncbi:MAG TPA: glutathione synthase [Gammaproteobacteria bacterium]|jgi:glutathione synthase|nr:glutathione synthase [Gammaproteobacteria bacterium]
MTLKLGVVMDPIASIHYQKDSTLAMLWEAQTRGWEIYYFEQTDLYLQDGMAYGNAKRLHVQQNENAWYSWNGAQSMLLQDLDIMLMRKDPPYNAAYIHTTQILDYAERNGVLVVNRPSALRDCNEKLFACDFPACTPPTLVTQSRERFFEFWQKYQDIVCKPLDTMGGESVFRVRHDDVNTNVIYEVLTKHGKEQMMVQQYIPEITLGDKRILMIDGEAIPYLLARVPHGSDWRGNLAVGAKGKVQKLSPRDQFIADQVGPVLRERGILFAGLDVIGDYLTEINITSPTCIREIEAGSDSPVTKLLFDCIESKL